MKKILYIRIDNTPVPQVLRDDIEKFDCRQINDFCSFISYAIIENLKNSDGTPYYRLIKPVGQLLMNFKIENAELFDTIISQWADILGDILHKGVSENDFYAIRFPQEYIDWLCQNEDLHYSYIGNNLKKNGSIVTLDAKGLEEDVISVLRLKIERYLHTNKDANEYVVFSNKCIDDSSFVIKHDKIINNFHFLSLSQWESCLLKEQHLQISNILQNFQSFYIDNYTLGKTLQHQVQGTQYDSSTIIYKGCWLRFNNGVWNNLYITRGSDSNETFNHFLSLLLCLNVDFKQLCYNDAYQLLIPIGFYVYTEPKIDEKGAFYSEWKFESDKLYCEFTLLDSFNTVECINVEKAKTIKGTPYSLKIEIKDDKNKINKEPAVEDVEDNSELDEWGPPSSWSALYSG